MNLSTPGAGPGVPHTSIIAPTKVTVPLQAGCKDAKITAYLRRAAGLAWHHMIGPGARPVATLTLEVKFTTSTSQLETDHPWSDMAWTRMRETARAGPSQISLDGMQRVVLEMEAAACVRLTRLIELDFGWPRFDLHCW